VLVGMEPEDASAGESKGDDGDREIEVSRTAYTSEQIPRLFSLSFLRSTTGSKAQGTDGIIAGTTISRNGHDVV